ncbi:ABC transporter permease [Aestuariivirga litoralis]|uniref:ABC transporter permease n=1 Tax=Aestuariivirga litoralis TaxID=2650924 RepID=UPI0018C5BCBA|nr:ABC transporter permease [Aestuariivirga litoralis]MBG1233153.1 ABC transporter permease [Aestuariivirga litoralis]
MRIERGLPLLTVCLVIFVIWYLACIPMNHVLTAPKIANAGGGLSNWLWFSWNEGRPVLPSPHQVIREIWNTVFAVEPWSIKSLIFHLWITLSSTLVGFIMGGLLGIALAIGIVHVGSLEKSLMPWIIASQTIPILAIAPMLIVVLGKTGLPDIFTKASISAYLCFFPVTIGMVKGLRSPDVMQQDLMRTYNASATQTLWKLRLPASLPFLFASLKVSVAIALTGAIVAELPTGAVAGIGARLLNGSYYGNTLQIWAALFVAAFAAATLVWILSESEKLSLKRMGAKP